MKVWPGSPYPPGATYDGAGTGFEVDPDNRREVDFDLRERLLAELPGLGVQEIMERMEEGLPKMWLIHQALGLRRSRPRAFGPGGEYRPVYARGKKSDHVVAFMRGKEVLTVVPRLVLGLDGEWEDTVLDLPPGDWENVLTGERFAGGAIGLSRLLSGFPVALLSGDRIRTAAAMPTTRT